MRRLYSDANCRTSSEPVFDLRERARCARGSGLLGGGLSVLRFSGTEYAMSKEGAAQALAWDAGANGRIEWRVVSADDKHVTIEGHETNEFLALIGVGSLAFRSTFEVTEHGAIASQSHHVDWGRVTLETAMEPLVTWASKHEPDELANIYPAGQMVYTQEMAERWVALARRWHVRRES